MIDVSDGLAADLGHLCRASGVSARLISTAVPVAEGATLDEALHGGDDYELCIATSDPQALIDAFTRAGIEAPTVVGAMAEGEGLTIEGPDGAVAPLGASGWDHDVR